MWKPYPIQNRISIDVMFSLFERYCEPDCRFLGEAHNFWECLYVEWGELCVSADERVYHLREGDLIFHKPLEFHKFYVEQENGADIFVFSFRMEGELSECFFNKAVSLLPEERACMERMIAYVRRMKPDAEADCENRKNYVSIFEESETFSHMLVSYLYQLLLPLSERETERKGLMREDAEIFKKAVQYMHANMNRQVQVAELSEFLNVSQSWLKRIFERFAGIGIHKYFLQMKMKKAVELLESGVRVSDTAERLGFSSQAYFSAAFRREMGKNASDFLP